MAHRRENYGVYGDPGFFSIGFIDSRGRSSHIKHLDHGAALATKIVAVATADIVGSNTALPVSRAGKSNQGILTGDKMLDLYGIAHSIDIRFRGFHPVIDQNASFDA